MISLCLLVLFVSVALGRPAELQNEKMITTDKYNSATAQPLDLKESEHQQKSQQLSGEPDEALQHNLNLRPPSEIHSRHQQDRNRPLRDQLEKMDQRNVDSSTTDNQALPDVLSHSSEINSPPFEIHSKHQQHRQQPIQETKPIEMGPKKLDLPGTESPSSNIDSTTPEILSSNKMGQQQNNYLTANNPENQQQQVLPTIIDKRTNLLPSEIRSQNNQNSNQPVPKINEHQLIEEKKLQPTSDSTNIQNKPCNQTKSSGEAKSQFTGPVIVAGPLSPPTPIPTRNPRFFLPYVSTYASRYPRPYYRNRLPYYGGYYGSPYLYGGGLGLGLGLGGYADYGGYSDYGGYGDYGGVDDMVIDIDY